jgi:hypothetical protein
MIMVPVMIAQIILFPYLAVTIRDTWVDSNINLELQEICGHLSSSIQQLYYTMNHASISSGSLTAKLGTPPLIGDGFGRFYNYTITFQNATSVGSEVKILNVTLQLQGRNGVSSSLVTLGENADWQNNATFLGSKTTLVALKTDDSIWVGFGDT